MSKQSKYSQEFRDTALELVAKGGKPTAQVAKDLGIEKHLLYSWVKTQKEKRVPVAKSGKPDKQPTSAEEELKELRRKNKQLETEVEILKKAAAYFAKTLL